MHIVSGISEVRRGRVNQHGGIAVGVKALFINDGSRRVRHLGNIAAMRLRVVVVGPGAAAEVDLTE